MGAFCILYVHFTLTLPVVTNVDHTFTVNLKAAMPRKHLIRSSKNIDPDTNEPGKNKFKRIRGVEVKREES